MRNFLLVNKTMKLHGSTHLLLKESDTFYTINYKHIRELLKLFLTNCHLLELSPPSQMLIIIIPIIQQPEQDRSAENQPSASLSSLNEYEYENENGMRKSETEL